MGEAAVELKDFVCEALVQIVTGVQEAREATKDTNAEISPTGLHFTPGEGSRVVYKPGRGIVQTVEFDVAVTTTNAKSGSGSAEAGAEAGIGVVTASVNLGMRGVVGKERAAANRVKFTVPILLPSTPHDWSKHPVRGQGATAGKI